MRSTVQAGAEQTNEEQPGRSSGAASDRPSYELCAHEHPARDLIGDAALHAEHLTGMFEETEDALRCGVTFRFARMVGGFFLIGIGIALWPHEELLGWLMLWIGGLSLLCFPETLRRQDPANSAIRHACMAGVSILIGNGIVFLSYDGPGWMMLYFGISLLPPFPQKLRWQDPVSAAERFDAEPTACLQCSAIIPAGQDKCPQCGWTYKSV
jgi:hypothetical protein